MNSLSKMKFHESPFREHLHLCCPVTFSSNITARDVTRLQRGTLTEEYTGRSARSTVRRSSVRSCVSSGETVGTTAIRARLPGRGGNRGIPAGNPGERRQFSVSVDSEDPCAARREPVGRVKCGVAFERGKGDRQGHVRRRVPRLRRFPER